MSISNADAKDIYINNTVVCKKEDLLTEDPSAIAIVTPTVATAQEQQLIMSSKLKNFYLERNEDDDMIPEVRFISSYSLEPSSSLTFNNGYNGQLSFTKYDYMKIIVYNNSDRKKPIFYELYNMNVSTKEWKFVKNSQKIPSQRISQYDITPSSSGSTLKTTINNHTSNYFAIVKLFSSRK